MTIENGTIVSPKSEEIAKGKISRKVVRLKKIRYALFFYLIEIVMKSNLSEPGARKSIKKKLVWADEKNQSLVQTSFFEVDDSELSEMHVFARNSLAHIPIAQLEKVMERDFRKHRGIHDVNGNDNDDKQFSTPLPTLIRILLPDTIQIPQIVSQERFVQEEREKTVLQALFIPAFLPDSPGEPDGDLLPTNNERHEAKLIPLDDVRIKRNHQCRNEEIFSSEIDSFHFDLVDVHLCFVYRNNKFLNNSLNLYMSMCRIRARLCRIKSHL